MAPGRRGRPAGSTKNKTSTSSSNPQQRISFGGPNAANKITKPSTLAGSGSNNAGKDGKKGKLSPSQQKVVKEVVELQQEEDEAEAQVVEEKEEATAAAATTAQEDQHLPLPQRHKHAARGPGPAPGPQAADPADETDALAAKVSEAQIRRFWAGKEASRIVGRVHQGGVGLHEKVLREWDLSSQFGSCIGISRTARWKRAERLGLKPPIEVLAVLMKEEEKDKKGGVQLAYVDRLMGGKVEDVVA